MIFLSILLAILGLMRMMVLGSMLFGWHLCCGWLFRAAESNISYLKSGQICISTVQQQPGSLKAVLPWKSVVSQRGQNLGQGFFLRNIEAFIDLFVKNSEPACFLACLSQVKERCSCPPVPSEILLMWAPGYVGLGLKCTGRNRCFPVDGRCRGQERSWFRN